MKHTQGVLGALHPVVSFSYFLAVFVCAMVFMHPVMHGIALFCSLLYLLFLKDAASVRSSLLFFLVLIITTAIFNTFSNHTGSTVVAHLPNGALVTKESFCYGLSAGVMLAIVICWFSCFHEIMTGDKLMYLFGRLLPAMSLVFSMTLRFVPQYKKQLLAVLEAQNNLGQGTKNGNLFARIRHGVSILSIMTTWSFEHAMDTADSMKGRGYGLKGRTCFSPFRFSSLDTFVLLYLGVLVIWMITATCLGAYAYQFFPVIVGVQTNALTIGGYVGYGLLCATPLLLECLEVRIWKS